MMDDQERQDLKDAGRWLGDGPPHREEYDEQRWADREADRHEEAHLARLREHPSYRELPSLLDEATAAVVALRVTLLATDVETANRMALELRQMAETIEKEVGALPRR